MVGSLVRWPSAGAGGRTCVRHTLRVVSAQIRVNFMVRWGRGGLKSANLEDEHVQLVGIVVIPTGKRFLERVQCPLHRAGVMFLWQ